MNLAAMGVFAGALAIASASPGPGITAYVGRVIGRGTYGAAAFAAGLVVGDLIWLAIAVFGLSLVAQSLGTIFLIIKYGGAVYLLYLAWRMWTASAAPQDIAADRRRDSRLRIFLAGLSLTLGNPKVIAFYIALVPNLIDIREIGVMEYAELALLCVAILTVVLGAYGMAAARTRNLFRSARALRLFNRTGGALMGCAAAAVVTR
jgi:threonine/homoserine/homoserine lactone efflux protein